MRVTSSGDRLNILMTSSYTFANDWMSFANWYSIYKTLPDANAVMSCSRDLKDGYVSYNWPYRCDLQFFQHENVGRKFGCLTLNRLYAAVLALNSETLKQPLLVLPDDVMALRNFSKDLLLKFNDPEITFGVSGPIWYFNNQPIERLVDALNRLCGEQCQSDSNGKKILHSISSVLGEPDIMLDLCCDCKQSKLASFVYYSNGCGRFDKNEWIKNGKYPPFYYASELAKNIEVSVNEQHVIDMWQQMRQVYDAVR